MAKLAFHLIIAGLTVFALRAASAPGWLVLCGVVLSLVLVHIVWGRIFADPFLALGAMAVSADDPLMLEAKRRALESFADFARIYPEHKEDSIVKFPISTSQGTEYVWGDLLELGSDTAKVYLRTLPAGEVELSDRHITIPVSSIIDWQIEFTDGTLRGGFTMQATYRIFARENGHMPRLFEEQLARYQPLNVLAA